MNQTFNIKRFGRYTRYILSMNRWYYGILLVLCVAAALFAGYYASDAAGLLYIVPIVVSFTPTIDYTMLAAQHGREIAVPASWLEKILFDYTTRIWPIIVEFCVHAACVAFSVNGATAYFADGFKVTNIAIFLLWVSLWMFFLYCFYAESNWRKNDQISQSKIAFCWWFAFVFNLGFNFGFTGFKLLNKHVPYSPLTVTILFTAAFVLFVVSVFLFRKREGR